MGPPLISMTLRRLLLPRPPSRLLSTTRQPEVLPPSRLPLPFTRSLPLHLLWPPLLPLPPSHTPVCTTLPTPMPSTTSAMLATLATPTMLGSSATPTLAFPSWPLPLPPLRNKLPTSSFSPSNSSRAFVHQNSFDCQSDP